MPKTLILLFAGFFFISASAQYSTSLKLKIIDVDHHPLPNATVELLQASDSSLLKIGMSDSAGMVVFDQLPPSGFIARVTRVGFTTTEIALQNTESNIIQLHPAGTTLHNVTVSAKKPFIELKPGKTIVNLDAGITNVGTTAMEALEKMPGITVDKDGNISLKGRAGVTILIDGKQTYLDPAQLATLLNGMNASQISQVEIMYQPSSRYDAAGNAGIINIKTKKNLQKGFNGTLSATYGQGRYPKNNNNLQLNYRTGKWNFFSNYSFSRNTGFTEVYALRTYFENDGTTVESMLEQFSFFKSTGYVHNLRVGADYAINSKTSIGLTLSGLSVDREGLGNNTALWIGPDNIEDSLLRTDNSSRTQWDNAGANLNFRHSFTANREITADFDMIGYRIRGDQFFQNIMVSPGTYTETFRAYIPSGINILSAKTDYSEQLKKWKIEAGLKTSHITTDNLAAYDNLLSNIWQPDYGRSNHFLYTENIHAIYGNAETKFDKLTVHGGLRYEATSYDAHQLGNSIVKDSSFSRSYNSLFPSAYFSYELDSNNTIALSAGRRIDRPAFQKLNPFQFVINKYTYQQGNPFFRPQYTWNIELSHLYKDILITGVNYSVTKDYFSQIFPLDSTGIVIYSEGNLGKLQVFGLSVGLQFPVTKWWSFSGQAVLHHRKMEGFIDREYREQITQMNFNVNNQFRFKKGWSAELTGFYTSRGRNDIQEVVDPAGQVAIGISKSIWQNKGTIRLSARDLFYTQWMKGLTYFPLATEYFKLVRDTRVITVSFTWRFGKAFKTTRRSQGASSEEIERVGNG